jgi:aminoglycoside phosphotransferase (APT) family kinase protein
MRPRPSRVLFRPCISRHPRKLQPIPRAASRWSGLQDGFTSSLKVIADDASVDVAREIWEKAVVAPAWHGVSTWLHGDLHPANVVAREGTLSGVIDFGELCAGDPATDLSAAWILLPAGSVSWFFGAYADADATIARARGWAVLRALHLISIGRNGRLGLPGGNRPGNRPADLRLKAP